MDLNDKLLELIEKIGLERVLALVERAESLTADLESAGVKFKQREGGSMSEEEGYTLADIIIGRGDGEAGALLREADAARTEYGNLRAGLGASMIGLGQSAENVQAQIDDAQAREQRALDALDARMFRDKQKVTRRNLGSGLSLMGHRPGTKARHETADQWAERFVAGLRRAAGGRTGRKATDAGAVRGLVDDLRALCTRKA